MNIIKFIESFTDDALMTQPTSRRGSLTQFGAIGKKAAYAAAPAGLLGLLLVPQKGSAVVLPPEPVQEGPVSAIQLGLMLEYLDSTFYQMGLDANGLIPAGRDRMVFEKIVMNENAHKAALIAALGGVNNPNYFAPPEFDFTANGLFPDPFNNYDVFLALSQAFEDTGVRAYKGQAPKLMSTPEHLTTALQIHSAEARQAAMVRQLRSEKGWITGNQRGGLDASLQPIYNGEETTTQRGFNTATFSNGSQGPAITSDAASQAFDEPLTRTQVLAIADPFVEGQPLV